MIGLFMSQGYNRTLNFVGRGSACRTAKAVFYFSSGYEAEIQQSPSLQAGYFPPDGFNPGRLSFW